MRFLKDGPSIPDELLNARDEGRVVFFCGAGVSRARAALPGFFGLAEKIIDALGVLPDHPARKIINEVQEIDTRTGVSGLISADRIFGLLERDFPVQDIETEVAQALKPADGVNLSAHQTLLDLAKTPEGKVRLVTTNFDRLFEACNNTLRSLKPPRLPDPSRHDEMDGIIHLHGYANADYSGSDGDGFVLTSSEFGRAYLSEGWATQFIQEILDRYFVVFVGYTADDPPVQYLLEALNKQPGTLKGVYAFQAGITGEANYKWQHKGVEAIPYDDADMHQALWQTLDAWAVRARNVDEWYSSTIERAKKGPAELEPHERGQVAHIVSTLEGARKFSEYDAPPPAEWLCVFDPYQRYETPDRIGKFGERGPHFDPFESYGLDSDPVPKKIDPEGSYKKRDVPENVWNCFVATRLDLQNLRADSYSAFRGYWGVNVPRLPGRLGQIGVWLAKVAHQPASVWWAAHQIGLHPDIQNRIQIEINRPENSSSPEVRKGWKYLIEAWAEPPEEIRRDMYELQASIKKDGWDIAVVREFVIASRPYLTAEKNSWDGPKPPGNRGDIKIGDMMRLDVGYPDQQNDFEIPDDWVAVNVREFRKNIELAVLLETELGGYGLRSICSIAPVDASEDEGHDRSHGLSGYLLFYANLFERLVEIDISAARQEFLAWRVDDETLFARLRIWASRDDRIVAGKEFDKLVAGLSDEVFWDIHHKRDLLLVLAKRWNDLPKSTRKKIEKRLLRGPKRWEEEEQDKFNERRSWKSLECIHWLHGQNCTFTFDLDATSKKFQKLAPDWKPEYAKGAVNSLGVHGGWVRTDTEHTPLLNEPLKTTLNKALLLSGRTDDFLVEKDPFAGLASEYPVRAFAALTDASRRDEYPEWAWRTFLNSEKRKEDKPKFSALIAERISRCPASAIAEIIIPASEWLLKVSSALSSNSPESFETVLTKLIETLRLQPEVDNSSRVRGNSEPDWAMEAINAPVGKIAQALMNDPRKDNLKDGEGFPAEWLSYVDDLLELSGVLRCHALVIFSFNMNWFFSKDAKWTEHNLLAALEQDNDDRNAVWSGFFWAGRVPNQKLYKRIKGNLLHVAKEKSLRRRGYLEALAGIILAGWGSVEAHSGQRYISNDEMRRVLIDVDDEFRSQTLWQIGRWSANDKDDADNSWPKMLAEFLTDVWPRQKSVKTPTISTRLCDLAFSDEERFSEIADIVLPLVTKIDKDHLFLPNLRKSKDNIVDKYPQQTVALLYAVLPDNVAAWPYGIDEVLQRIGEADNTLRQDERFLELNRKWNAR